MAKVFISYAREDQSWALQLYADLQGQGHEPWIDKHQILPGEKWRTAVAREIWESSCFITLLSNRSVSQRGTFLDELNEALEVQRAIPENQIFLIPVRLDECEPPFVIKKNINWIDLFPDYGSGFADLVRAIERDEKRPELRAAEPPRVVVIGAGAGFVVQSAFQPPGAAVPPPRPIVPWRALPSPEALDIFRLLDWRSRLTPLLGRDDDLGELLRWAEEGAGVLVRFLVGPGGAGKSRLALEAADALRQKGWEAGQIFLDRPFSAPVSRGAFLVVDYPEASRQQVRDLLRDLARVEQPPMTIRVLLLSRLVMREWHSVIDAEGAASICDAQEVRLGPIETPLAVRLFRDAVTRFSEHLQRAEPALPAEAFAAWLDRDRESNGLPLFILSAALHCALEGGEELSLSGAQIVAALVRRERMRLDKLGGKAEPRWGENGVSRVAGLATVAGGLDKAALRRLAADAEVGFPAGDAVAAVRSLGLWEEQRVPAPSPDILAAELLFEVLDDCPDRAAEWLWECLAETVLQNVDRLGRIAYDVAKLRGPDGFDRLTGWFAATVEGQPQRAASWQPIAEEDRLPLGVLPLAVAVGRSLLAVRGENAAERAKLLTLLAERLNDAGDAARALEASREAAQIYVDLRSKDPGSYEPELARALRSLAVCLRSANEAAGALEVSREAAQIWRRLAELDPRYESDLARSLRTYSICLSESQPGDEPSALEVLHEAATLWRRLVKENSARYEPDLAECLNTLSVYLSEAEDVTAALAAVREAVEIWRRLAEANPARYESGLALGLNNLSRDLRATGDNVGAMKAIRESLRIYSRVAAANPELYEPDWSRSFENLSRDLSDTEDPEAAVNALREAVQMRRRLVLANPRRFAPGVARQLDRLSDDLSAPGDAAGVIQALRVAQVTVVILLVRGENPDGQPIYAYVALRADRLETFMEAQLQGIFYPEDFGVIVEVGEGEPSPEVREKMATEYGFNHEQMVDIPDADRAHDIIAAIAAEE